MTEIAISTPPSLDEFVDWCQKWIDDGKTFVGYCYANGCGVMDTAIAKRKQLNRFRETIDALRKEKNALPVYVVEYDGRNLATYTEGGDLDALCTLSVPGDSDPVGP